MSGKENSNGMTGASAPPPGPDPNERATSALEASGLGPAADAVEVDQLGVGEAAPPVVVGEGASPVLATPALDQSSVELNNRWQTIKSDIYSSAAEIRGLAQIPVAEAEEVVFGGDNNGGNNGFGGDGTFVEDDPRDVLDNSKSMIPFHMTGRFDSLEKLTELVNSDFDVKQNRDPADSALAVLKVVTVFPALINVCVKKTTIMKDHFRVAKQRCTYKLYGPGAHYPKMTDFHWYDKAQPFDLESEDTTTASHGSLRRISPVHTFLQVGPGSLGFGRINSADGVHADGEVAKGRDGDTVLFAQGKYLLKEANYRDIKLVYMAPNENIISVDGMATLMRIDAGQVGGALRLETNEFEIFRSGKTIVLDNKEWAEPCVVNRVGGIFTLRKYVQFITIDEGYVASISRKDGRQFLLSEPGQYVLKHSNWDFANTVLCSNDDNYTIGPFIVKTVSSDEVGVARNRWTNESFILKKGKYYLHSSKWEVNVKPIARAEVYIKPFRFIQVGTSMYVGARNLIKGSFDEFHDKFENKIIVLHETQYASAVQVPKVSSNVMRFGPWFTVTVSAGKVALFDRRGTISVEGNGQKKLALEEGVILEPLPTVGLTIHLGDIKFLSSDDFDLGVRVNVDFRISDHIKLATLLRSRATNEATDLDEMNTDFVNANCDDRSRIDQKSHKFYQKAWSFTFDDFKAELMQLATSNVLSLFRTYKSSDLIIGSALGSKKGTNEGPAAQVEAAEKARIEKNIEQITEQCSAMLMESLENNQVGIKITKIHLLGGIRFADPQVLENFKARTREATRAETMVAIGKSNEARAKAESVAHIEKAREEATIKTLQLEGARKHEAIQLETLRLKTEQEIASEQLKRKKQLESEKLQLEQQHHMELEQAKMEAAIKTLRVEEQQKQRIIELEIEKENAVKAVEMEKIRTQVGAEVELLRLKAEKEQAAILNETKRMRAEADRVLALERIRAEKEIELIKSQLAAEVEKQRAMAEAEAIKALADAEEYRQRKINAMALERPHNLDIEKVLALMNQGIEHFGQAAWRHPDLVEAMVGISKDGATSGTGTGNGGYQSVVSQSVNQAISVMQMMELKSLKNSQSEPKKDEFITPNEAA